MDILKVLKQILLSKEVDNAKAKLYLNIFNFVLWIIALILCLVWYDFKLFLILWVVLFANNLQQHINTKYN